MAMCFMCLWNKFLGNIATNTRKKLLLTSISVLLTTQPNSSGSMKTCCSTAERPSPATVLTKCWNSNICLKTNKHHHTKNPTPQHTIQQIHMKDVPSVFSSKDWYKEFTEHLCPSLFPECPQWFRCCCCQVVPLISWVGHTFANSLSILCKALF